MTRKELKQQRIKHLKNKKKVANKLLKENISVQNDHQVQWIRDVNKNNIEKLKNIISQINKEQHDKAINEYVEDELQDYLVKLEQGHFLAHPEIDNYMRSLIMQSEEFSIFLYSPAYSMTYDLYWIEDGTVGDQINIVSGEATPDVYEKYCPEKIKIVVDDVIPYLSKFKRFKETSKVIQEVSSIFNNNNHITVNILLMTVIESLVRELCRFIYGAQNSDLSTEDVKNYIDRFMSMESLITKGEWENDLEITAVEAHMKSRYIKDEVLDEASKKLMRSQQANRDLKRKNRKLKELSTLWAKGDNDQSSHKNELLGLLEEMGNISKNVLGSEYNVMVSIKVELQFLVRRFKEDRNSIIHGSYYGFDKGWKSFIYLSALIKIYKLILRYDSKYGLQ